MPSPAKPKSASASAKPPGTPPKRAKKAAPKKSPAPKGPRVIASIVEFLKSASAKAPLSKDALLAKLVKRFPDREPESMGKTISCQLGARIEREQGIKLKKNEDGYWIA